MKTASHCVGIIAGLPVPGFKINYVFARKLTVNLTSVYLQWIDTLIGLQIVFVS